jgi:spore coat protein A, manganese oxidase
MIDRRNVLKLGTLAAAGVALPAERLTGAFGTAAVAAPAGPAPLFGVPLTTPRVLKPRFTVGNVDYYDVTMKESSADILPGVRTPVWTYDGSFPGPTIRARRGRTALVRQFNDLGEQVAVHLHGGNVSSSSDGLPGDEIRPGDSRYYLYPNRQQAATLWYHDHVHHVEAEHTNRGLAGLYLITDPAEDHLDLPAGTYDVPLIIQDRLFDADGTMRLADPAKGEFCGDTMLVNGRVSPFFEVEQRPYRFRLLNASSNDCLHELKLSTGEAFTVIATDGGLLPAPVQAKSLPLAPSERIEIVIDFSRYAIGEQIVLDSTVLGFLPFQIMRFDVKRKGSGQHPKLPSKLVPMTWLKESHAKVRRDFVLNLDRATGQMVINGKPFDPQRIDITPRLGTTEVWTVTNGEQADLPIPHVFHTHLVRFQILDRDGRPPGGHESGWKDSVAIQPGEKVRLIMRFGDFPGRYLYHCHLLGHADAGMMATMKVLP